MKIMKSILSEIKESVSNLISTVCSFGGMREKLEKAENNEIVNKLIEATERKEIYWIFKKGIVTDRYSSKLPAFITVYNGKEYMIFADKYSNQLMISVSYVTENGKVVDYPTNANINKKIINGLSQYKDMVFLKYRVHGINKLRDLIIFNCNN